MTNFEDLQNIVKLINGELLRVEYASKKFFEGDTTIRISTTCKDSENNIEKIALQRPSLSQLTDEIDAKLKLESVVLYVPDVQNAYKSGGGYLDINFKSKQIEDDSKVLLPKQIKTIKEMGYNIRNKTNLLIQNYNNKNKK